MNIKIYNLARKSFKNPEPFNESSNRPFNESSYRSSNDSSNRPLNESSNRPLNESSNRPFKESSNRWGNNDNSTSRFNQTGSNYNQNNNSRRERNTDITSSVTPTIKKKPAKCRKGMVRMDVSSIMSLSSNSIDHHKPDVRPTQTNCETVKYETLCILI